MVTINSRQYAILNNNYVDDSIDGVFVVFVVRICHAIYVGHRIDINQIGY